MDLIMEILSGIVTLVCIYFGFMVLGFLITIVLGGSR